MRKSYKLKSVVMMVILLSMMVSVSFAVEAVVEKEKVPGVIITKELIKTADNFIVMFDSSSSMKEPFKDTGLTSLDAAKKLLPEFCTQIVSVRYVRHFFFMSSSCSHQ
jgi:hypothetical protein